MKVPYIVGAIVLVGIAGYFLLVKSTTQPSSPGSIAVQKNESQSQTTQDANTQSEFDKRFVAYSGENLSKATKNGRAVVFFHASWCSTCSEAEADLKANWGRVPSDVSILKTDYDSSKELKVKYGITMQDTWVQVDATGNELSKWNSGGNGLETLLANLK